jgi:hypothetical protein
MRGPGTDRQAKCPTCGTIEKRVDGIRITKDELETLVQGNPVALWCNHCSAKTDMIHIEQEQLRNLTAASLDESGHPEFRFIYVPVDSLTYMPRDEYVLSCQRCGTWYVAFHDRFDEFCDRCGEDLGNCVCPGGSTHEKGLSKLQPEGRKYSLVRARDHDGDGRPWYERDWPNMRHGQKIKVEYASLGLLKHRQEDVRRIALKWIRRLRSTVSYDLAGKMFIFDEVIDDILARDAMVRANRYCNPKGNWLTAEEELVRVRRGNYSLAVIRLLTADWPRFSSSSLENDIVRGLLHIVRPQIGRLIKNRDLIEDEDYMHEITRKLIKNFERMSESDKQALLNGSVRPRRKRKFLAKAT